MHADEPGAAQHRHVLARDFCFFCLFALTSAPTLLGTNY